MFSPKFTLLFPDKKKWKLIFKVSPDFRVAGNPVIQAGPELCGLSLFLTQCVIDSTTGYLCSRFLFSVCFCLFQFKNAGIIEMEASMKACKVLIMQKVRSAQFLNLHYYPLRSCYVFGHFQFSFTMYDIYTRGGKSWRKFYQSIIMDIILLDYLLFGYITSILLLV